jgi:hypothetical protein
MKLAEDKKLIFKTMEGAGASTMEGAGASVKFGLAGLAAGASTAWVTDRAWNFVSPYVNMGGRGAVTQSALTAVAAGALASVMIFAGDRALESIVDMGNDPLFRTTYYQAAFLGSSTARSAVSNVQVVLNSVVAPSTLGILPPPSQGPVKYTPPPPKGYGGGVGPVMQAPRRAVPSCQSGMSCGAIKL